MSGHDNSRVMKPLSLFWGLWIEQWRLKLRILLVWVFLSLVRKIFLSRRQKAALRLSGQGKTAVITGAASGVGRHVVSILARAHWRVYCVDINEPALAALDEELGHHFDIHTAAVDITDGDALISFKEGLVQDLADSGYQGIDVLVNGAGIVLPSPSLGGTWEQINLQAQVNLLAPIRLCHLLVEQLVTGPRPGVIINVASLAGRTAWPWQGIYSSTKAGLIGFSDALRRETRASGLPLRIHTICPGPIDTPLVLQSINSEQTWVKQHPDNLFTRGMEGSAKRHADATKSITTSNRLFYLSPESVAQKIVATANDNKAPEDCVMNAPFFVPLYFLLTQLPTVIADKIFTFM